jgi:hypothetical protein
MAKLDYSTLVARQRDYFLAGNTRPVSWRKAQLEAKNRFFNCLCCHSERSVGGVKNPRSVLRHSRRISFRKSSFTTFRTSLRVAQDDRHSRDNAFVNFIICQTHRMN